MVISPTVTLTGSYVLWVSGGGDDVGTWAISTMQGIQVIGFLVVFILGQWLALKVWP